MSRKGINGDDERCHDSTQGSTIGGILSILCVSLLAMQSISLFTSMFAGSNDLIQRNVRQNDFA